MLLKKRKAHIIVVFDNLQLMYDVLIMESKEEA